MYWHVAGREFVAGGVCGLTFVWRCVDWHMAGCVCGLVLGWLCVWTGAWLAVCVDWLLAGGVCVDWNLAGGVCVDWCLVGCVCMAG